VPAVSATFDGRFTALGIEEACTNANGGWVYNGVGVWTSAEHGDSISVTLGSLDWPGRLVGHVVVILRIHPAVRLCKSVTPATTLVMLALVIANAANAAQQAVDKPFWHVLIEGSFGLTILFIFVTAIITVVVQGRKKDRCLKFLHDYHVSYLTTQGQVIWGNALVYSKGLELVFDAPYRTQRGIYKTSQLLWEADLANCLALCRADDALTDKEQRKRRRHVRKSFRLGPIRRMRRSLHNIMSTLKDAFSKAMGTVMGQLSKGVAKTNVLVTQKAGVEQIGQSALTAAGNAYEPMLERHIGKPVILHVATPTGPTQQFIDIPGYLVDYSDKYVAVFNVDHEPIQRDELTVTESIERPGYKIEWTAATVVVTCTGPEILLVKRFKTQHRDATLEIAIINGNSIELGRGGCESVAMVIELTRRIDIVCPRTHGTVYFGGALVEQTRTLESQYQAGRPAQESRIVPEQEVEEASDDPVQGAGSNEQSTKG